MDEFVWFVILKAKSLLINVYRYKTEVIYRWCSNRNNIMLVVGY